MPLSEQARKNKIAYNAKRLKELYTKFAANLLKDEYIEICDYLKSINMNKAEFIRWAYEELKKRS
jgi:hypothetical protein